MKHTSSHKIFCWKVTSLCNRKCEFCFDYGKKKKSSSYKLESLILRFKELGVEKISITGGEPLILHNLNKIISALSKNNIKSILTTNGDFIGKYIISALQNCEYVKISFYGYQCMHDKIMGKGHFKFLSEKIKFLQNNQIDVGVNYLLTHQSIEELDKFLRFCTDIKVKHILLQTYLASNSYIKKRKNISTLSGNDIDSVISIGSKYCNRINGSLKVHNYQNTYFSLLLTPNLDFEFFDTKANNFQVLGNIYDQDIYNPFSMLKENTEHIINMLWDYRLNTNSIIPID